MNYRNRCNYYVFTVTHNLEGEIFFRELRRANRKCGGGFLFRMGRNKNRSGIDKHTRKQGRLPIKLSDRWDLYCKVKYTGDYTNWRNTLGTRTEKFIREAGYIIHKYRHLIQYANSNYKPVFDQLMVFSTAPVTPVTPVPTKTVKQGCEWSTKHNRWEPVYTKVPVTPSVETKNPKYNEQLGGDVIIPAPVIKENQMNTKTSIWKVTLKSDVSVQGETHADLVRTLKGMGFLEQDLLSYEKVDTHKDLPLIRFGYPRHGNTYNESVTRDIRVTKMNSTEIEGYEVATGVWKKFFRNKVVGRVDVVEIPAKQ